MHPTPAPVTVSSSGRKFAPASTVSGRTVRGTQSFVYTMSWCWRHPSLIAIEVAWRWCFGVFALSLIYAQGRRIAAVATAGTFDLRRLGLDHLTLLDPTGIAIRLTGAATVLAPLCLPVLRWLVPLLVAVWIIISALGRTAVLRRADRTLHSRPLTLIALQLLRAAVLGLVLLLWFRLLVWAAATSITGPLNAGREPSLLLYFVILILGTLVVFILWAVASWWLSIAPLLAMLEDLGVAGALRASFHLGPLTMKLIEINLVMGIVKAALVVLAMVFSATPLPFESVATPAFLTVWCLGVSVLYLLGSDFFHVTRQVAYLRLWQATRLDASAQPPPGFTDPSSVLP